MNKVRVSLVALAITVFFPSQAWAASLGQPMVAKTLLPQVSVRNFSEMQAILHNIKNPLQRHEYGITYASAKQEGLLSSVQTLAVTEQVSTRAAVLTAEIGEQKIEPTVLPTVQPQTTPEVADQNTAGALNADKLYALVDNYRQSLGYAPLQHDARLKEIAVARTPELFDEIFVTNTMHAGFHARAAALPFFATENMIYYNTEEGAFNWWLNSPVHRATMQNSSYTHADIACEGKACTMIYSGFQPK